MPQRLKIQNGDFQAKNHKLLKFFDLVPKSPTHTGMICVKTPEPNISCLAPFKIKKGAFSNSCISAN
jgi:hypothetical protein